MEDFIPPAAHTNVIVALSGKRKSGKDFLAENLVTRWDF